MNKWLMKLGAGWALDHWKQIVAWVLARLREPSTYGGLFALLLTNLHLTFSADAQDVGVKAIMNLAAFLAIVLKEKGIITETQGD